MRMEIGNTISTFKVDINGIPSTDEIERRILQLHGSLQAWRSSIETLRCHEIEAAPTLASAEPSATPASTSSIPITLTFTSHVLYPAGNTEDHNDVQEGIERGVRDEEATACHFKADLDGLIQRIRQPSSQIDNSSNGSHPNDPSTAQANYLFVTDSMDDGSLVPVLKEPRDSSPDGFPRSRPVTGQTIQQSHPPCSRASSVIDLSAVYSEESSASSSDEQPTLAQLHADTIAGSEEWDEVVIAACQTCEKLGRVCRVYMRDLLLGHVGTSCASCRLAGDHCDAPPRRRSPRRSRAIVGAPHPGRPLLGPKNKTKSSRPGRPLGSKNNRRRGRPRGSKNRSK